MSHRWQTAAVLVVVAGAMGCSGSSDVPAAIGHSPPDDAGVGTVQNSAVAKNNESAANRPVTADEEMSLGWKLEQAILADDPQAFTATFDIDRFAKGVIARTTKTGGLEQTEALVQATSKEVARVLEEFAAGLFRDQSFALLMIREREGTKRLLFRSLKSGGAPTYIETKIEHCDGSAKATDIFIYLHNQWLSEMMNVAAENPSTGLFEIDQFETDGPLREMLQACQSGDSQRATELYRQSPRDDRERRLFMLLLIPATKDRDEPGFQFAVEECNSRFSDDVQINVSLASAFRDKLRFDDAIDSLRKVQAVVGGDPYLGAWAADVYLASGQTDRAKDQVATILSKAPGDWDSDVWLLKNCLKRQDYAQAVDVLRAIENEFEPGTLDKFHFSSYPEFLKSTEYKEWVARRK
jgi:tetratricopeptide (TPR) repeat protein